MAKKLFLLWGRFVSLLPRDGKALCETLQTTWLRDQRAWWGGRLSSTDVRIQKLLQPRETDEFRTSFKELRAQTSPSPSICDKSLLKEPARLPRRPRDVYRRRNDTGAFVSGRSSIGTTTAGLI